MAKLQVAYVCTFFMFTGTEEESGIMLVGWLASERLACTCFEWMSPMVKAKEERERVEGNVWGRQSSQRCSICNR